MTKQKIFFIILGIIVFWGLIYFILTLNSWTKVAPNTANSSDFKVWILEDDASKFQDFISGFKSAYPQYKDTIMIVESFSEKQSYYNSLISAILLWQGPDVFVLENSETSPFENQIKLLDPTIVSPNDFRLRFKPIFWEKLIITDDKDSNQEYVKWVPLWYETLGLFYNRKYFLRPSDMGTWEDILTEIKNISEKYSDISAIALWDGSSVTRAADIVLSFLSLEWATSLKDTGGNQIKQALSLYTAFWESSGWNNYNDLAKPFLGKKDIDFFTQWNVASMIWYPRDLVEIDKIGYQKSFLFATPFPSYAGKTKKQAIHFNFFAINKDTKYPSTTANFLAYMYSTQGQQKYIDTFPYYLPGETSVEKNMWEKKILPAYNVIYNNFIDPEAELVSFDVGDNQLFQTETVSILDRESWYDSAFEKMRAFIVCTSTKQQTLLNLSSPCKL